MDVVDRPEMKAVEADKLLSVIPFPIEARRAHGRTIDCMQGMTADSRSYEHLT